MPSMTRDDVDALNAFVKAGHIDEARALLEGMDGEKAASALKRLNDRYPPAPSKVKSPSVKGDPLAEAKRLIILKEYDQAEALLWESDDPAAGELLRKLTLVKSAGAKDAPMNNPIKARQIAKPSTGRLVRWGVIAALLILIIGGGIYLYWRSETYPERLREQVTDVCLRVAITVREREQYRSDNAIVAACEREVDDVFSRNVIAMSQCYDSIGTDYYAWLDCMADKGTTFSMQYLAAALS
jgi:hypothetical protein